MELRAFGERILTTPSLAVKLERVRAPFTDVEPGEPFRVERPARPDELQFAPRRTAPPMPAFTTFGDPHKRGVAHHIMANHELQALEVMAATLLAFPHAPRDFRLGMARIMEDEQRHTTMHFERCAALGVPFGSLPVNSYIWQKAADFRDVLDYLAGLPLTFEGCNLDHTLEFEAAFLAVSDSKSAAMMRRIHEDEIEHVAFGFHWLSQLKPAHQSEWDAYQQHLHWPLRAEKSVGDAYHRPPREAAGLTQAFLDSLEATLREPPTQEHGP